MERKFRNMKEATDPLDMYEPLEVMGKGAFGAVTKCRNKLTGEIVAVKTVKTAQNTNKVILRELLMLKAINSLDPDAYNIVRFNKYFKSGTGDHFFEFEMLDQSVLDLMKKRREPFSLQEIRPMAKQLLVALHGLQRRRVMHTDIKPGNIMLVDHEKKPFRVKLIDFGLGILESKSKIGMTMQPLAYRAPEVTLGLPLTVAVDMWSLGCCLLEWFLGVIPFYVHSSYDILDQTSHLLGVPEGDLISRAKRGADFFVLEDSRWRLKTPSEYQSATGMFPEMGDSVLDEVKDLEDAILNFSPKPSGLEIEDRKAFLDLMQKIFVVNPKNRITPAEALRHPFITKSHFRAAVNYILDSDQIMNPDLNPVMGSDQDLGRVITYV